VPYTVSIRDSTQPDRDTELALPAENPNVGAAKILRCLKRDRTAHLDCQKTGLALKSQSWQNAEQQGLTPTQGQILALLIDKGDAGMRLSEVAKHLAVTAAAASDAVTSLIR